MIFILSFAFLLIAFLCVALAFSIDLFSQVVFHRHSLPSWILLKLLR